MIALVPYRERNNAGREKAPLVDSDGRFESPILAEIEEELQRTVKPFGGDDVVKVVAVEATRRTRGESIDGGMHRDFFVFFDDFLVFLDQQLGHSLVFYEDQSVLFLRRVRDEK